jgi:hypothetical protein
MAKKLNKNKFNNEIVENNADQINEIDAVSENIDIQKKEVLFKT